MAPKPPKPAAAAAAAAAAAHAAGAPPSPAALLAGLALAPGVPAGSSAAPRIEAHPEGFFTPRGRFGRMFPELPALVVNEAVLVDLGARIHAAPPSPDNPDIPAGYTYLGQFVDHDITFDPTTLGEKQADPLGFRNARTPALDLDALYGRGPGEQPYLYFKVPPGGGVPKLLLASTQPVPPAAPNSLPNDLPRAGATGIALLGDPRNDENLIVAQFHLSMIKFHGQVVTGVPGVLAPAPSFSEARRIVTWTYQLMLVQDFLRRIADPAIVDEVFAEGRRFYRTGPGFSDGPYIPVEFSAAAYRLGHSMVRETYDYNRIFAPPGAATLAQLFQFTGGGGGASPRLPSNWIIDWRRFFPLDRAVVPNPSLRIDGTLTAALGAFAPRPLATLNLLRGNKLGLPSGQAVARRMGLTPLTAAEVAQEFDAAFLQQTGLDAATPLWFYVLQEALVQAQGRHLGEVGSRLVAEVFLGLLEEDPGSYLRQDPLWKTPIPLADPAVCTMADILRFVNDVNPLGP